jgi:hypothetical protein
MFIGRPFLFQCDFCKITFQKFGYGLPEGMKWIAGNYLKDQPLRHICADCIKKRIDSKVISFEKGYCVLEGEKLHNSGEK